MISTRSSELTIKDLSGFHEEVKAKVLEAPQAQIDVLHIFEPGKYIREMRAKAGTIIVGAEHRYSTFNVFVKGAGDFKMPDGSFEHREAPQTFVSEPGSKIVYVTEDLVWQNWFPTEIKDVQLLEALLFKEEPELLENQFKQYLLDWNSHEQDRRSFESAIEDIGIPLDQVEALVNNEDDQIPLPYGSYKVRIGTSSIHGKGVLCTANIQAGEIIGTARAGVSRTPLGRYINHSDEPNAIGIQVGDDIVVQALRPIRGVGSVHGQGEEITVDYRNSVHLSRTIGR